METPLISVEQHNKIRSFFPVRKHAKRLDDRKVISAIILVIRFGLPWRHIPEFYGNWRSIYSRFRRWSKAGIIARAFSRMAFEFSKNCIAMIDSTFSKAQRCASSLRSDGKTRELGRSRGGITTKIHLLCSAEGKPLDFFLTGGQTHDIKAAPILVKRNDINTIIGDKAYGSKSLRKLLAERDIKACIPPKKNKKVKDEYDKKLYEKRHVIENMFSRLKDWKGIAFRGNRCAYSFHAFVSMALIFIFLNADRT